MDRISELKALLGNELQQISQQAVTRARLLGSPVNRDADGQAVQERIALLGQLIAGLAIVDPALLESAGAAYGSTVVVEDVQTGVQREYTLMVGELVNLDAGQVSLGSPIGQALLNAKSGDLVAIAIPQGAMQLRVVEVRSIEQLVQKDASGVYNRPHAHQETARLRTA